MLNLSELLESYPVVLRTHRSFILREYLQCKILELLFEGPYANRFCFLGGTCQQLDMEEMVKDVRNFLFYPADEKKIRLFWPLLEQSDF